MSLRIRLTNAVTGVAEWLKGINGAAYIYNPELQDPVTTEIRRIFAEIGATTSAILLGETTPTAIDGDELVEWNSFTNLPKRIRAISSGMPVVDGMMGWLFVINVSNPTAAATLINNACKTGVDADGVGEALAASVDGDISYDTYFVPLNGVVEFKFDTPIADVYISPITAGATAAVSDGYCQLEFRP